MASVGVFDSGVGGLTVLKSLRARWPNESFVYLADTARLPYGSKSLHTISLYAEQCIQFLRNFDLKALVVACNSASTALIERPVKADFPIFNVVTPGARKAAEVSSSGRIGVLGTRATVHSEAYVRAVHKFNPGAVVVQQPCPLFVPLVEEGWIDDPITNLIVYRYVNELTRKRIDTLILGCTHYPVLRRPIANAAGSDIRLVDSTDGLLEDLEPLNLGGGEDHGTIRILCTDFSPRLQETVGMILEDVTVDSLETVDI